MSIYTEDRETFEAQMFAPARRAPLMEHAGRFVGRLNNLDKDALLRGALDRFWETREQINTAPDILKLWVRALESAARGRSKWHLWSSGYDWWVKGSQLGRQS